MCNPTVIQSQQDLIELLFIRGMLFSWITEGKNLENKKSSLYLDLLLLLHARLMYDLSRLVPYGEGRQRRAAQA